MRQRREEAPGVLPVRPVWGRPVQPLSPELYRAMIELEAAIVLAIQAATRLGPLTAHAPEWDEWAGELVADALALRAVREEWAA